MSKNNYAGKKITTEVYLSAMLRKFKVDDEDDDYMFIITPDDAGKIDGFISLGSKTISMTVPDVDLDTRMIDSMKEEQQKISAEAHLKVQNIEETIQKMLALPAPEEE